ncbi:hypothetical protein BH11MYX2_BH11MYX2_19550 [soil metagenome]
MRAAWLVAARAPVPTGFRSIHPSWIEAALGELPERARSVLGGGATSAPKPLDEQVDVWLARWACATFPAMPAVDDSLVSPRVPADVARMSASSVLAWLTGVGADQLAFAVGDAAAQFGPTVIEAGRRIAKPPRLNALGPRRDAINRAQVTPPVWQHLHVIGARAVAPHVDATMASVLVHRFDRAIGTVLRDELRVHSALPPSTTATWRALAD